MAERGGRVKLLVTGGAGFIGSNFVRFLVDREPGAHIVNLDALTYAGNLENLADLDGHTGHEFVHGSITDAELVHDLLDGAHAVVNFAAESHVDRSLVSAMPFVDTNVVGTQVLLAAARERGVDRFVQVSTDEVYGELPWHDPDAAETGPKFTESTPLAPRSPYAATKAAADLLALAYHATHGMDVVVTRCSNNYGPYQFPEKLIPLMIANALEEEPLPVYGDGLNVRDWIHVDDHCRGIHAALTRGRAGRIYNFGGDAERTNLTVVTTILEAVGASDDLITFVKDRSGHDRRYAIDASRAADELGWAPERRFDEGLAATVRWYVENRPWWERVRSGEYRTYYERMYGAGGRHA
jgi:dTDP-glucose 4,6-dehydratase